MAHVFRVPWRRQWRRRPLRVGLPPRLATLAVTLAPATLVATDVAFRSGRLAATLAPVALASAATAAPLAEPACALPQAVEVCPTRDELRPQILALFPRGRAWGEGGKGREPGGGIYAFADALAIVFSALHQAICALALEFFCSSETLTHEWWLLEYGLPDGCDPYPDVCAKIAASGGTTCAYYTQVAWRLGWSITCADAECALMVGCIEAGMAGGPAYSSALVVVVDLAASPAYQGVQIIGAVAGYLEAGMSPACGPDLTALDCLLQRIVGAHVQIYYQTI